MGYQEKRSWILLGVETLFYSTYFWELHHGHLHFHTALWIILGMVVAQIVLHSVLALTTLPAKKDERDIGIENRAYRTGYLALCLSVVAVLAVVAHRFEGPVLQSFFVVNTLLFVLAVAELAKLVTQVTLYRRYA